MRNALTATSRSLPAAHRCYAGSHADSRACNRGNRGAALARLLPSCSKGNIAPACLFDDIYHLDSQAVRYALVGTYDNSAQIIE